MRHGRGCGLFLLVLPLVWLGTFFSLTDMSRAQLFLQALMRTLLLCALCLCLSRPQVEGTQAKLSLVALCDVSDSMGEGQLAATRTFLEDLRALAKQRKDELHIVTFASRPHKLDLPKEGEKLPDLRAALLARRPALRAAAPLAEAKHVTSASRPLHELREEARIALSRGDVVRAKSTLFGALAHWTVREEEYVEVVREMRDLLWRTNDRRGALTLDWYAGDERTQRGMLGEVPPLDRARTLLAWADRATNDVRKREIYARAADEYEQAGLVARAAIARERADDFVRARALWSRLAQMLLFVASREATGAFDDADA